MKKILSLILALVLCLGIAVPALATDSDPLSDYSWHVTDDDVIVVDRYWGSDEYVTVPGEAYGCPVVRIGDYAFYGTKAKYVELGEGILSIGDFAFADTRSLKAIKLPNSLVKIGRCAFIYDTNLFSVDYGTGLQIIDSEAFGFCYKLEKAVLPEGMQTIAIGAFENCTSLSELVLPSTLLSIQQIAFYNTTALKKAGVTCNCDLANVAVGQSNGAINKLKATADAEAAAKRAAAEAEFFANLPVGLVNP